MTSGNERRYEELNLLVKSQTSKKHDSDTKKNARMKKGPMKMERRRKDEAKGAMEGIISKGVKMLMKTTAPEEEKALRKTDRTRRARSWRRLSAVATALAVMLGCSTVAQAQESPYRVTVNRNTNYVAIYARDAAGNYSLPVIEFGCSTGKNNATPTGASQITAKYEYRKMFGDNVYARYATRFQGNHLFHAPPSVGENPGQVKVKYINALGEQASAGCVRLAANDAKWIKDNCPLGTVVEVIDQPDDYGPFGKPLMPSILESATTLNWDPTDPDPQNPWAEKRPVVKLVANATSANALTLPARSSYDTLYNSVSVTTPQGVAYAAGEYGLDIYGVYNLNAPGTYTLYLRGFDLKTTLRGDLTVTLNVTE